jgi:hypothetical protein
MFFSCDVILLLVVWCLTTPAEIRRAEGTNTAATNEAIAAFKPSPIPSRRLVRKK